MTYETPPRLDCEVHQRALTADQFRQQKAEI